MVCGGLAVFLTAHGHTDVLSSQILVVVCGGLRWCVVVCGGLWWFAVVCGGLWWIAVVCLLVIPFVKDCLCCELKCRFILVGLIVIKVFPRLVGLMTLLDHHHGKSIKINVSYKIGILDLI